MMAVCTLELRIYVYQKRRVNTVVQTAVESVISKLGCLYMVILFNHEGSR